jgi:hypothetical protein
VDRLDYAPGAPRLVRPATGGLPDLNTWHGMGISPEAGLVDIDPWLDLLINHVADDNLRQWIIAWCAYPLQNLGSKLNTYPLIFGPSGMGKNLFLMPLHRIYGDNAVLVGKDNLISTFNSVYAQKQLIHVDELSRARGDGQDTITQRVKMITTSDKTVVNTKGVKEYTVRNVANLAITSNYADCIKLDNDDRRCCVVRWDSDEARGVDHRGDQSYWMRYVKWLDGGGPAALYAWLLEQDIAWFDPSAWALDTPWKAQVTEATQTSTQVWCRDLYSDPDSTLPTIGSDVGKALFTSKELCVLAFSCSPDDVTQHQSQIMSGDLRNAGFKQANGGKPVKIPNRPLARYWIIRQRGKEWNHSEEAEHVKKY